MYIDNVYPILRDDPKFPDHFQAHCDEYAISLLYSGGKPPPPPTSTTTTTTASGSGSKSSTAIPLPGRGAQKVRQRAELDAKYFGTSELIKKDLGTYIKYICLYRYIWMCMYKIIYLRFAMGYLAIT